jgi:uncharacterized protein YqhQ
VGFGERAMRLSDVHDKAGSSILGMVMVGIKMFSLMNIPSVHKRIFSTNFLGIIKF